MYVVDASVWVARFYKRDAFHDPSKEWITTMMTGSVRLVEPVVVLAEVAGALSRAAGDQEDARGAVATLTGIPVLSLLPIDQRLARRAALVATELGLRGYDAVYVALAESLGMTLISWDSDHLSRASGLIDVRRPSDLLAEYRGDQ